MPIRVPRRTISSMMQAAGLGVVVLLAYAGANAVHARSPIPPCARGIPGSAISIAASTPISSAWRPRGAMAVCAFPIHVRRMGPAAAPPLAINLRALGSYRVSMAIGCRKYQSSIRVLVFALLSGTAVP